MPERLLLILLTTLTLTVPAAAQNGGYTLFRTYTVADGLPSNHIYNCMEDNQGFLWVTSDAGISRFDGKHFQTFTTKDGLPDEEVLDAVTENNGRIWVNCFKQGACYFDAKKNRFINGNQDSNFFKIKGSRNVQLSALKDGGVMYSNENGSYLYNNDSFVSFVPKGLSFALAKVILRYSDGSFITYSVSGVTATVFHIKDYKIVDSLRLGIRSNLRVNNNSVQDNKYYTLNADSGITYVLSDFKLHPLRCSVDSVSIGTPMMWQRLTRNYFTVVSKNGIIYLFDKSDMKFCFAISGNYTPNTMYDDSKGNIWVCSVDKGLFMYKKKQIESFAMPDNFTNTHFLSIARKINGSLLAGNFSGEIVETDGRYFIVHSLPKSSGTAWQRKIIVNKDKVFSFSEGGTYINYSIPLLDMAGHTLVSKTAAAINDSTILHVSFSGLGKINVGNGKLISVFSFPRRIVCMAFDWNLMYYGSTDGLYKFDLKTQREVPLPLSDPLLHERVIGITITADKYLWVATASHGVIVMRNDTVVQKFSTENGIISHGIKCISNGQNGEIWVGTNMGITILRYNHSPVDYSYQNLTINDGLSSNIINEMLYDKDTMYCATGNGICAIPANINLLKFNIPVYLTAISVNNKDTALAQNYELDYKQNHIEMHFAGIELGGHFNFFQYRFDNDEWQDLTTNALILELNSGKHIVEVRAVDVNGHSGIKNLAIKFDISTPFWKTVWFWLLITFCSVVIIVWMLRRRELGKREIALQAMLNQKKLTELELQALKAQINPHFIFNCLNSIKLLNHQGRYMEAEKYLDSFSSLLRAAIEHSSLQEIRLQDEIEFIENYLLLEKMRQPDKFSYSINKADGLDASELLIPSMMLQPYVENAVKHGMSSLNGRPGLVEVRFYRNDDSLIAEVQDNGNSADSSLFENISTGIGIKNTERRSRLYNIKSSITDLKMSNPALTGRLVQLIIPLRKNKLA